MPKREGFPIHDKDSDDKRFAKKPRLSESLTSDDASDESCAQLPDGPSVISVQQLHMNLVSSTMQTESFSMDLGYSEQLSELSGTMHVESATPLPGPSGIQAKRPNTCLVSSCSHSMESGSSDQMSGQSGANCRQSTRFILPNLYEGTYSMDLGPSDIDSGITMAESQGRTHHSRADNRNKPSMQQATDGPKENMSNATTERGTSVGSSGSAESMDVVDSSLRRVESSSSVERDEKGNYLDWTGSRM